MTDEPKVDQLGYWAHDDCTQGQHQTCLSAVRCQRDRLRAQVARVEADCVHYLKVDETEGVSYCIHCGAVNPSERPATPVEPEKRCSVCGLLPDQHDGELHEAGPGQRVSHGSDDVVLEITASYPVEED